MTRLPQLFLLAATFALVGCDRNEGSPANNTAPANSSAVQNAPANRARENDQRAAAANGTPADNNDAARTTNVEHNSTGTSGAGSPGTGTNPPATQP